MAKALGALGARENSPGGAVDQAAEAREGISGLDNLVDQDAVLLPRGADPLQLDVTTDGVSADHVDVIAIREEAGDPPIQRRHGAVVGQHPGDPEARRRAADVRVGTLPEPESPRPPHRNDTEERPDPPPRRTLGRVHRLHPPLRQRSLGDRRQAEEKSQLLPQAEGVEIVAHVGLGTEELGAILAAHLAIIRKL